METIPTGKIYDIQGFSVQDGPGIRTTVFLKGCPLRCPWCHSPESQSFSGELSYMKMRCVGLDLCGECLKVCPNGAITPGVRAYSEVKQAEIQLPEVDRSKCDDCGACAKACPAEALYICGRNYTVDEILARVLKDKAFYLKSGGGVTISGGEALAQPAFTKALLRALKENSIHTALDTTGFAPWETVAAVLPYTDLFLYDLKTMDDDLHKRVIGVSNRPILENAKRIADNGGKMHIRIPLIPLFNENDDNIRKTGEFCRELGDAVTGIQLLPYHNLGIAKYERLLWQKPVFEAQPIRDERVAEIKAVLEQYGFNVKIH